MDPQFLAMMAQGQPGSMGSFRSQAMPVGDVLPFLPRSKGLNPLNTTEGARGYEGGAGGIVQLRGPIESYHSNNPNLLGQSPQKYAAEQQQLHSGIWGNYQPSSGDTAQTSFPIPPAGQSAQDPSSVQRLIDALMGTRGTKY